MQIDQEKRNEVSSTLDKILDDFKQMRKENQQLMVKVKDWADNVVTLLIYLCAEC